MYWGLVRRLEDFTRRLSKLSRYKYLMLVHFPSCPLDLRYVLAAPPKGEGRGNPIEGNRKRKTEVGECIEEISGWSLESWGLENWRTSENRSIILKTESEMFSKSSRIKIVMYMVPQYLVLLLLKPMVVKPHRWVYDSPCPSTPVTSFSRSTLSHPKPLTTLPRGCRVECPHRWRVNVGQQ